MLTFVVNKLTKNGEYESLETDSSHPISTLMWFLETCLKDLWSGEITQVIIERKDNDSKN